MTDLVEENGQEAESIKPISKKTIVFFSPFACLSLAMLIMIFVGGICGIYHGIDTVCHPQEVGEDIGLFLGIFLFIMGFIMMSFAGLVVIFGNINQYRLLFSKDPKKKHQGAEAVCIWGWFGIIGLIGSVVIAGIIVFVDKQIEIGGFRVDSGTDVGYIIGGIVGVTLFFRTIGNKVLK